MNRLFVACFLLMLLGTGLDHWTTSLKLSLPPRTIVTYATEDSWGGRVESPVDYETLKFASLAEWALWDFVIAAGFIGLTMVMSEIAERLVPGAGVCAALIPLLMGLIRVAVSVQNLAFFFSWH